METITHIETSFSDDRGEIINLIEENIEQIALIKSKKKSTPLFPQVISRSQVGAWCRSIRMSAEK
ncbi:MAG: hypothetical protein IIA45_15800 [Bacteroidetes bacterium]|nr:hypothetical protein [Bacteroidota bacterium]